MQIIVSSLIINITFTVLPKSGIFIDEVYSKNES